jgi:hypothetical protein
VKSAGSYSGCTTIRTDTGIADNVACAQLCSDEPLCTAASYGESGSAIAGNCNLLHSCTGESSTPTAVTKIECRSTGFSDVPDLATLKTALQDYCDEGSDRMTIEYEHGKVELWKFPTITSMANLGNSLDATAQANCNPNLAYWDVSAVTDFTGVFRNMAAFDQDLSAWVMSSAVNLNYMFHNAVVFNNGGSDLIQNWDVSSVTSMSYTFAGQHGSFMAFNQPLGSWDVSSVTTMANMFQYCSNFNQDLGAWQLDSLTRTDAMFLNALSFNNGGVSTIDNWDMDQVTTLKQMFAGAVSFNQPIGSWDVSEVTTIQEFMSGDNAGTAVFNQPLNTWNLAKCTQFYYAFAKQPLFNQNLNGFVKAAATHLHFMFLSATSFNNGGISPMIWDTSNVENMEYLFRNNYVFDASIDNWNVSSVTTMVGMFEDAHAFNQPLDSWDTSKVKTWSHMFYNAKSFDQSVNHFNIDAAREHALVVGISNAVTSRLFYQTFAGMDAMTHVLTWDPTYTDANGNKQLFIRTDSLGNSQYMFSGSPGLSYNEALAASASLTWATNSPTMAPGIDLNQDQTVVTTKIDNQNLVYTNTSTTSFSLSNYNFSVDFTEGSDGHNTTGWVREVKFAKCRSAEDLLAYTPVTDACSGTIIDDFAFEYTTNPGKDTVERSLRFIMDAEASCPDVTFTDGTDSSTLKWFVSYNAAKNLTVNSTGHQQYEYTCIEREFQVSFSNKLNTVATFEATDRLADTVQEVKVVKTEMNACAAAVTCLTAQNHRTQAATTIPPQIQL